MALRVKTVEYALDPRLTTLATNTTLATATRYDAAALTLTLPETTSRTFRSVKLFIGWRDGFTAAVNITGWRVGIKLGAVAFSDTDYTSAVGNTGEQEGGILTHDVTSYFVTNFGAASTQTCQVGFAMATSVASLVNNVTMKLIITYEYDDSGLTEEVKTVRIPIQSYHTTLTTSHIEIGTVTGTTNAPANQIPQLTGTGGFLPEGSVSVKRAWIEWWANDTGVATTDFSLIYQIDATTEVTHVLLEAAFATGALFYSHSIYDTATHATTSAHALKARTNSAGRFGCLGAVLHVTYTYDPTTTTTVCNSVMFAIGGDEVPPGYMNGTTSADEDAISVNLWVEEPTTITLKQSGVLLYVTSPGGGTLNVLGGGQTYRPYTLSALVNSSGFMVVHRVDHSSGFSLARGQNENLLKMYFTNANAATMTGGFAFMNYHSGVAATGINSHNKTTFWSIDDMLTAGTVAVSKEIATTNQRTPNIPETSYWINRLGYDLFVRQGAVSFTINLLAQKAAGEHNGDGWYPLGISTCTTDTELGLTRFTFPALSAFNRTPFNTDGMSIETARKYRLQSLAANMSWLAGIWMTYHSITFSVSGSISGSSGGTVTITAYDSTDKKALGSTSRTGNGAYTITVYDNSRTMYTEARESDTLIGRSANGTAT